MTPASDDPEAKKAGGTATVPAPPPVPSGDEVYDRIMGEVEPELMTSQLPLLKDKYKDETPEESRTRARRYTDAFKEYDRRYRQYLLEQKSTLRIYQHNLVRSSEDRSTGREQGILTDIESQISSL